MEIVPLVGTQPITADTVSVNVNPDDRARAKALVLRTSVITAVSDQDSFLVAKRAAGQLKAMVNEIVDSKKAAKRPFAAVERAIDDLAGEVGKPVADEHSRVLDLLNGYVARLEAAAKEEQRKKDEALAKQIAAQQEQLRQAQAAQLKAEEEARGAKDEVERINAQAEAKRRAEVAEAAKLSSEMAGEIAKIGEKPKRSFVPGGRVDHPYEFKLVDLQACLKAGGWRLLRWELDKRSCQDSCRAQLELNPDAQPVLPGIEITQTVNVSVRASAKIT